MMNGSKQVQIIRLIVIVVGLCAGIVSLSAWGEPFTMRKFAVIGIFSVTILATAIGMWFLKRWALLLSFLIALIFFGFGCFGVWFGLYFYPNDLPPFSYRLWHAVASPFVLPFLVLPVLWIIYFTRPKVWNQFVKVGSNLDI